MVDPIIAKNISCIINLFLAMTTELSSTSAESSMEIDLQFDENGRTRCKLNTGQMDYNSKTVMTDLDSLSSKLDDLLFDCEIADCGLLPRTYWMPLDCKPRCLLEEMALQVFHYHVKEAGYDLERSGAEWWVQLRPSPPGMGRYAMLSSDNENEDNDITKSGISFHWDKDEDLRIAAGGNLHVHPHLSTVTYLSSIGAPTMVCHRRVHPVSGEWLEDDDDDEGYLCWPRRGKHLSFDGRYLHAAPPDFLREGEWESQIAEEKELTDENEIKLSQRRHRRVTFLVNVWLNHKPFNVDMFPDSMVGKLSKLSENDKFQLFPSNTSTLTATSVDINRNENADKDIMSPFTWSMGGSESQERISFRVPLDKVRHESSTGPNFCLLWQKGTLILSNGGDGGDDTQMAKKESLTTTERVNREPSVENDTPCEQPTKKQRSDLQ